MSDMILSEISSVVECQENDLGPKCTIGASSSGGRWFESTVSGLLSKPSGVDYD